MQDKSQANDDRPSDNRPNSDHPNGDRPNIAEISGKLAADNSRVNGFVDGLVYRIDTLVNATTRSDWEEVCRLSSFIARSSAIYGYPIISESAKKVCQATDEGQDDQAAIRRSVVKLIGTCGRARRPLARDASNS